MRTNHPHSGTIPAEGTHGTWSTFNQGRCRFEVTCTCGDTFDSPVIDEVLEYEDLQRSLAPLIDQMDALDAGAR